VFEELKAMENIHIDFNIGLEYTYKLLESTYELGDAINTVLEFGNPTVTDSLHMIPQAFCGKYNNQITITPDGYVLGCASEVSSPNYDKLSAGNVLDSSLKDIIKAGKEKCIKCNTNYMDTHETAFENCPHIFEESY
jgi:radical SAM protein with 4Fe4S-binding SPASM domain